MFEVLHIGGVTMGRKPDYDVRIHAQEREWLQNLGEGDLVEGARNLIQKLLGKQNEDRESFKGKWRKSSQW